MALIICEECGIEYSNRATSCPKCGCPTRIDKVESEPQEKGSVFRVVFGVMFALFFIGSGAIYAIGSGIWSVAESGIKAIDEAMPPQTLFEGEVQIKEDQMMYYELPLSHDGEMQVTYKVKAGPGIDAYFVDADNLYRWKRAMEEGVWDQEFSYFPPLSSYGTTLSDRSSTVSAGEYYLILDNSDYGDTVPPMNFEDDVATLDVKVTFE